MFYNFSIFKTVTLFLIVSLFSSHLYSQSNIADITNPEILELTEKANHCSDNRLGNCDEIYEQAIKLGEKLNEPYVDYLYYLLALNKIINGDSEGSMKIYHEQFPKSKNEMVKVAFLNLKGGNLRANGKLEEAIETYIEINNILEKSNEKEKLILNYYNIAAIFDALYNFEKEREYLLKAYNLIKETGKTELEITVVSSISQSYLSEEIFEKSKEWAEKAILIPPKNSQDKKALSTAYWNLGSIYSYNKNTLDKALDYANQSISILDFIKSDDITLANAIYGKALVLYERGEFQEAKTTIDQSIQMLKNLNAGSHLITILRYGGLIYEKTGDYKGATELLKRHAEMIEEYRLKENIKTIGELSIKYETEKKERQIAEQELEIQKKNVQMRNWLIAGIILLGGFLVYFYVMRRNQKNTIKIMEKEKENEILSARVLGEEVERSRISKELHDGIASNLVAVKLQIENNAEISQKILSLVQETHKEVRQIAHNLMPINFDYQNLVDVIKSFCEECTTKNRSVNFQTNVEKINLDKDRSMVLYRIVQEFIQNAVKHSQAKQIDVFLMENKGIVSLNIEDNGMGFDSKLKETSKGLSGIIDRLEKIKGRINIDSSDKGTSVFISIKTN